MIKAVLIDDEKNASELLEWQLHTYCPQVAVTAICSNADQGIAAVRHHQPQLVFIDIEMPKKSGFEVLQAFPNPAFDVIFTTAYSQFALRAFRFAALDYLLKPIDADDLVAAVQRYEKRAQQHRQPNRLPERISFGSQQAVHFIRPETIVYCESASNYTTLFFLDNTKLVVSKTLKEVEEVIVPYGFLRIHHSYVINLKQVSRLIKTEGGMIEMSNAVQLPISRGRKDELMQALMY